MVICAETPDRSRAAVSRIDAESAEARIVVQQTASASGRLVDLAGTPLCGRKLSYGIRIHLGPTNTSPFSWHFGGAAATDDQGRFTIAGLVVGETYKLSIWGPDQSRIGTARTRIAPTDPSPLELGDVSIDLSPQKPYVPPTPAQLTGQSFAARKEKSPREKLAYVLTEAKREYTRPLLLFGSPKDPACIDLFRLFDEQSANVDEAKGKPPVKMPGDLRWEFELSALETTQADVRAFAKELGVPLRNGDPPRLTVLSDEGKLTAAYLLRLGADGKLDARALGAFLLEHKLPTRDAETMLADGLAKAKADKKRVFLIMSASWCGPCRMLARYLVANNAELERHYVFVKLDISRDTRASALKERYEGKDASNGVPWYVILDAAGEPLTTSNAKEIAEDSGSTNVGFPSSKEGIDHFLSMLKQTVPGLSDEAIAALRQGLDKKP
jgi:thiol-disulfide isomerase/thioredoxin